LFGVNAPASVTIDVSSIILNQTLQATLNPIAGTGQDVTPICPNMLTVCNGGSNPGVQNGSMKEIYNYRKQVPTGFSHSPLCCRNTAINTIVNPGGENITLNRT